MMDDEALPHVKVNSCHFKILAQKAQVSHLAWLLSSFLHLTSFVHLRWEGKGYKERSWGCTKWNTRRGGLDAVIRIINSISHFWNHWSIRRWSHWEKQLSVLFAQLGSIKPMLENMRQWDDVIKHRSKLKWIKREKNMIVIGAISASLVELRLDEAHKVSPKHTFTPPSMKLTKLNSARSLFWNVMKTDGCSRYNTAANLLCFSIWVNVADKGQNQYGGIYWNTEDQTQDFKLHSETSWGWGAGKRAGPTRLTRNRWAETGEATPPPTNRQENRRALGNRYKPNRTAASKRNSSCFRNFLNQ